MLAGKRTVYNIGGDNMSDTFMIVFWAVAFVFFLVCEVATCTSLVSIWFALGSLVSLFLAIAKVDFLVQCIVFVVSSAVFLALTRPFVRKLQGKKVATNYELDEGMTAAVIEDIDNIANKGRVRLSGTDWAARSENGENIPAGHAVVVVKVDGSKLIVRE